MPSGQGLGTEDTVRPIRHGMHRISRQALGRTVKARADSPIAGW